MSNVQTLFEEARQAELHMRRFRGRVATALGRSELIQMNGALSTLLAAAARGYRLDPATLRYQTGPTLPGDDLPMEQ